jgi:hypothetical protein
MSNKVVQGTWAIDSFNNHCNMFKNITIGKTIILEQVILAAETVDEYIVVTANAYDEKNQGELLISPKRKPSLEFKSLGKNNLVLIIEQFTAIVHDRETKL